MRIITATLLCLWSVASAEDPVPAELITNPFNENVDPDVSVSGNVIVGIMTESATLAITKDQIAINAGAFSGGQHLCLKAASRDGIYTSINVYKLPDDAAGNIRLPYYKHSTEHDVVHRCRSTAAMVSRNALAEARQLYFVSCVLPLATSDARSCWSLARRMI